MVWVFYFRRRTTPVGAYELMGAPKTNQNEALWMDGQVTKWEKLTNGILLDVIVPPFSARFVEQEFLVNNFPMRNLQSPAKGSKLFAAIFLLHATLPPKNLPQKSVTKLGQIYIASTPTNKHSGMSYKEPVSPCCFNRFSATEGGKKKRILTSFPPNQQRSANI